MPMGNVAPQLSYVSRLWNEGEILNGNPLRFVAPVEEMYSGSIWEQSPAALNDSIVFNNLQLNTAQYELIWLVAESPTGSTNVEITVNGVTWLNNIDLSALAVGMREIRVTNQVLSTGASINFINRSNLGGFIAATRFSMIQIF